MNSMQIKGYAAQIGYSDDESLWPNKLKRNKILNKYRKAVAVVLRATAIGYHLLLTFSP